MQVAPKGTKIVSAGVFCVQQARTHAARMSVTVGKDEGGGGREREAVGGEEEEVGGRGDEQAGGKEETVGSDGDGGETDEGRRTGICDGKWDADGRAAC